MARLTIAAALGLVIVGAVADLVLDDPAGASWVNSLLDLAVVALSLLAASLLWRAWRTAEESLAHTARALAARTEERDTYLRDAQVSLAGLAAAIDAQLVAWELTPAEREVTLLLVKGHSHKEIAYLTHRSVRTVRQHAVEAYRKSGLAGRAELAAYFLGALGGETGKVERNDGVARQFGYDHEAQTPAEPAP